MWAMTGQSSAFGPSSPPSLTSPTSLAFPLRLALLRKRLQSFLAIFRVERAPRIGQLLAPRVFFIPVDRALNDFFCCGERGRAVHEQPLGEPHRLIESTAVLRHAIDDA